MPSVDVVAALIWDHDRFLICRRPPTKKRGLLWEFVGGKVEPNESRQQALIRECREELAITVAVGSLFTEVLHAYPDLTIRLCLYRCRIAEGIPQLLEHVDIKWITPEEIPQYDFCPADEIILKMIRLEHHLRKELDLHCDPSYQTFQSKLLPTLPSEQVLGIRTPLLRTIAKKLNKLPDGLFYTKIFTHNSFEELQLHAFLINEQTDYPTALASVEQLLPAIDNWATCDQLSPRAFSHQPALHSECYRWLQSPLPFTVRFGIKMLMDHFLQGAFAAEDLCTVAAIRSEAYYVNMMISWYLATALIYHKDAVVPYLEQRKLPAWVHRKTIQKSVESNRLDTELKHYLKTLRY